MIDFILLSIFYIWIIAALSSVLVSVFILCFNSHLKLKQYDSNDSLNFICVVNTLFSFAFFPIFFKYLFFAIRKNKQERIKAANESEYNNIRDELYSLLNYHNGQDPYYFFRHYRNDNVKGFLPEKAAELVKKHYETMREPDLIRLLHKEIKYVSNSDYLLYKYKDYL